MRLSLLILLRSCLKEDEAELVDEAIDSIKLPALQIESSVIVSYSLMGSVELQPLAKKRSR